MNRRALYNRTNEHSIKELSRKKEDDKSEPVRGKAPKQFQIRSSKSQAKSKFLQSSYQSKNTVPENDTSLNKAGFKKFIDGPYNTFASKNKFISSELSIQKMGSATNPLTFDERKDIRFKKGRLMTAKTNQAFLHTKANNLMNESTDENLLLANEKNPSSLMRGECPYENSPKT